MREIKGLKIFEEYKKGSFQSLSVKKNQIEVFIYIVIISFSVFNPSSISSR